MVFQPHDWYWTIGDAGVYSSKRNIYVPSDDPDFVAWQESNVEPITLANEAEVWYYVRDSLPAWLWNGEMCSQPALNQYHTYQLTNYSAMKRWETETKGIKVSGVPLRTDDRSKQMLGNARAKAKDDESFTTTWIGSDGKLYPVTSADMIKMADGVSDHVDACFDRYATLDGQIKSGQVTTLKQIDDAYAGI